MFYKEKGFYISVASAVVAIIVFSVVCMRMTSGTDQTEKANTNDNLVAQVTPKAAIETTPQTVTTPEPKKAKSKEASGKKNVTSEMHFNQERGLAWPVTGKVIMEYSPDKAIYYKTMGSYRTNDAIVISSKVGQPVKASAAGVVSSIAEDDEHGTIVTMSVGDQFTVSYGQLKNVAVRKGQKVKEGQILGRVAKPTKYFSSEGANLYYQVKNKNSTVNPMVFLR